MNMIKMSTIIAALTTTMVFSGTATSASNHSADRAATESAPATVGSRVDRYTGGGWTAPRTGSARINSAAGRGGSSNSRTEAGIGGPSVRPIYRNSTQRLQEFNKELRRKVGK